MGLILQGLLLGFTLAILLGPIFITLTQLSVEKGFRAGITASSGVWFSDILIVSVCYFFIAYISDIINDDTFTYWMGLLGGFILIVFGIGAILNNSKLEFSKLKHSTNDYISFFSKGFIVNTFNPFTFVFWIGVISTYVLGAGISQTEAMIFLGSILAVIVCTDTLKVYMAKKIRNKIKPIHFSYFTKVAGIGLIIFGVVLLYKSHVF